MFALVDCNNFYASCERVFNPSLRNTPIVVLSNNDGCVIARSQEAKDMGIKMGVPAFEIENLITRNRVQAFSSNYTLYGDMSQRVMATLSTFVPEMEIYSIDEAFLSFHGFEKHYDLDGYAQLIRKTVQKNTGIPVCIGIGPTKTLAKLANRTAKKNPSSGGVCLLNSKDEIENALKVFPIEDVWGVGRRYANMLQQNNINTAYDFSKALPNWVNKKMTIVGLRTWHELNGSACIPLEKNPPTKQNICVSRSFGKSQKDYSIIEEAVSTFASRAAAKLRRQKTCAKVVIVFIQTNFFQKDHPQYSRSISVELPVATNSSFEIVQYVCKGLRKLYREGYEYKKAGVIVAELVPATQVMSAMFDTIDRAKHATVMKSLDILNTRFGREKVKIAKQGSGRTWRLKQEKISRCYSTMLSEIIEIQ